ncbi:MAG: hypothetical protein K6E13_00940 [Lachnospiraceae bacterium]|nr:hypothetical protein [Lachnospiraceae bacterium]
MKEFLYGIVGVIAEIHTYIMSINDVKDYGFSDKELHFLVIGALGMIGIFIIHPIFTMLAKTGHVMVITWVYVVTLLTVITFAIEIGQKVTNTGAMDFADIVSGMLGFFLMFLVFALIRGMIHLIIDLIKSIKGED